MFLSCLYLLGSVYPILLEDSTGKLEQKLEPKILSAILWWFNQRMAERVRVSVAGYGGLRLSFHGITEYLHGLVSVYERPIIVGVQLLMVYSSG